MGNLIKIVFIGLAVAAFIGAVGLMMVAFFNIVGTCIRSLVRSIR